MVLSKETELYVNLTGFVSSGCAICAGKKTIIQVHEDWDKSVDDLLCNKHLKELNETMKKAQVVK